MKKLVFLFAMVLAVTVVSAQTTTNLWQAGSSNNANVTQVGSDMNSIFATQSGNANILTSVQLGLDNNIDLLQSGNGNKATMTQDAYDQTWLPGALAPATNTSKVVQRGSNNNARLGQMEEMGDTDDGLFPLFGSLVPVPEADRSVNVANAWQKGNGNNYVLNQGRDELRADNTSKLYQQGSSNTAGITQKGLVNWSEIRQSGNANVANLMQSGIDIPRFLGVATTSYDKSFSWQSGNGNRLTAKQVGEVDNQLAESVQSGANNNTRITQVGFTVQDVNAWMPGNSNVLVVKQIEVE